MEAFVACAMLEAMSSCLESTVRCSGVGPGGSYWREVCSKFCHLGEIRVDFGSCLVSVLGMECRCSGESAMGSHLN